MIKKIISGIKSLDIKQMLYEVLDQTDTILTDLNKEQLYSGFDSEGQRLSEYKQKEYSLFKNELNPAPGLGNPDLYVTGAFYDSFKIRIESNKVLFLADDSKALELISKYGNAILGLSENNLGIYLKNYLQPMMTEKLKTKLNEILR